MMDDYLEFRPKEGGDDAVVGVSRRDIRSIHLQETDCCSSYLFAVVSLVVCAL